MNLSAFSHPAWLWLTDQAIPQHVKQHYSPDARWKGKPFEQRDALFFFKGIEQLSQLFIERFSPRLLSYFQHASFRSSYLLYFFPLQAAKFLNLFETHPQAIQALFTQAKQNGRLTLLDIGSGPGTASFSFLIYCMHHFPKSDLPIDLYWCDTSLSILKEGETLLQAFVDRFPQWKGKVRLFLWNAPWANLKTPFPSELSLVFFGNVLNENKNDQDRLVNYFFSPSQIKQLQGAGVLFVEPATAFASRQLSRLRDQLLETKRITNLWGPCLHLGACPLTQGKNWCHFSSPLQIPGKWFSFFSKQLGSERNWSKYSYLWIQASLKSPQNPVLSLPKDPGLRLAVSDPIPTPQGPIILLCEPDKVRRWKTQKKIFRGQHVSLTLSSVEKTPNLKGTSKKKFKNIKNKRSREW